MMTLLDENSVRTIFVQIIIVVLGWGAQYINSKFSTEKQWRNIKEESSQDKFTKLFLKLYFWGLILMVICLVTIMFIEMLFSWHVNESLVHIVYVVLCTISYAYLAIVRKPKGIVFKRDYKYKKIWAFVLDKVAIGLCCLSWISTYMGEEFVFVAIVVIIIFEITYLSILDAQRKYKYEFAIFSFYSGKAIDNIRTKNIVQQGHWIIVIDETKGVEYRFRVKDVEKVEYKN